VVFGTANLILMLTLRGSVVPERIVFLTLALLTTTVTPLRPRLGSIGYLIVWIALGFAPVAETGDLAITNAVSAFLMGRFLPLRLALFQRLQTLSLRFFHERKTGELLSRVILDVAAMQNMLTHLIGPAVSSIITILGLSAFLLTAAAWLLRSPGRTKTSGSMNWSAGPYPV